MAPIARLPSREQILELRVRLKMTQEAFAEHLGVARNTVARWEMGANLPRGPVGVRIVRELNRVRTFDKRTIVVEPEETDAAPQDSRGER